MMSMALRVRVERGKREARLRRYDSLHPVDAVVRSWTTPGANPEAHRRAQSAVREAMPLLARGLDRLATVRRRR